jgi:hypothetical protein
VGDAVVTVGGRPFGVGDRVITRINTPEVSNRERWEVIGVDPSKHRLDLRRVGDESRGVRLERKYLEQVTPSGEPAIQHAYALTTYSTESKTFDSAFALLDSGISREDFLAAISRARGTTVAYGVAASEFTDPDLGPGKRVLEDAAHELRAGAERTAGEYAAVEVALRKRIEAQAPADLARRRADLERRLAVGRERSPAAERLEAVEARIAAAQSSLTGLVAEASAGSAKSSNIVAREGVAIAQLRRLEDERDSIKVEIATEPVRADLSPNERTELGVIEDRLAQLRRRDIAAERLRTTKMIEESLGQRPSDPLKAALWNEGVDLIYAYRQRHGVTSVSGHPLGPKPRDSVQRHDRRRAETRLARVQQGLDLQRVRSSERGMHIAR